MGATNPADRCPRHHPQGTGAVDRREHGPRLGLGGENAAIEIAFFFDEDEIVG